MAIRVWTLLIGNPLVGYEFWKRMCREHGIEPNGVLHAEEEGVVDRKDVFFYQVCAVGFHVTDCRPTTIIMFHGRFFSIWSQR